MNSLFVTCSSGLEPFLEEELHELGLNSTRQGFRGVYVESNDYDVIYLINYCSRIASRVLLPLKRFFCKNKQDLYHHSREIDWFEYLPAGKTFAIDANVNHTELRNSLFAAQVLKDAICDQFRERIGTRPSVDIANPDVQLNLFIQKNQAILSVDTSGVPLHKRGYRQEAGEAPLRESLAAALLRIAQYQGTEILCDPCCGSGTFLIEAAMIASRTPPGYLRRHWGFKYLPGFSSEAWLKIKNKADEKRKTLTKGHFFGIELDQKVTQSCRANMRAAGFLDVMDIYRGDFQKIQLPIKPNFLITNPPHGKRLGDTEQLKNLYQSLGDYMKQAMEKPSRAFVFTSSQELAKAIRLSPQRRHVIDNSGIDSRLMEYNIY